MRPWSTAAALTMPKPLKEGSKALSARSSYWSAGSTKALQQVLLKRPEFGIR
jgi:hypothetical protein